MIRIVYPFPGPGIRVESVLNVPVTGENWDDAQRQIQNHPAYQHRRPWIERFDEHPNGTCFVVDTQIGDTPCEANVWPGDVLVLDAQGKLWVDCPRHNLKKVEQ